jgi:hypothetical protein
MTKTSRGTVTIPADINVWDHELKTAQVLARYGHRVEFVVADNGYRIKSADILVDGVPYEIKSPRTDKLSAVERNLKRASHQSANIIIDSRRMSKLHDSTVQKYLLQKLRQQKTIKKLLFVNRKHELIDISSF